MLNSPVVDVVLPAGYTNSRPADYSELFSLAKIGANALEKVHNTEYLIGTIPDLLYTSSGPPLFPYSPPKITERNIPNRSKMILVNFGDLIGSILVIFGVF